MQGEEERKGAEACELGRCNYIRYNFYDLRKYFENKWREIKTVENVQQIYYFMKVKNYDISRYNNISQKY